MKCQLVLFCDLPDGHDTPHQMVVGDPNHHARPDMVHPRVRTFLPADAPEWVVQWMEDNNLVAISRALYDDLRGVSVRSAAGMLTMPLCPRCDDRGAP